MYIPMVQIPGCQPLDESDNRDGREPKDDQLRPTVFLPFGSLPTYEAAAEFYSYIAYPHPDEETQREKYRIALSRWAVLERGKIDKSWNESTEAEIRPVIFSQAEKLYKDTYRRGSITWWERGICASLMLLPHMLQELFEGLPPGVENVLGVLGAKWNYSVGSNKTIANRIWRPTKPVAHAAAAAILCLGTLKDPEHKWDDEHQLCYKQPFLATLFYEDVFRNILLNLTSQLYLQIPSCRRFKIRECEMINFALGY
ncbi:MAG TPA: hypothetical protein VH592_17795 [Gemmataceae bacterium]|jgi:hypothetical protein